MIPCGSFAHALTLFDSVLQHRRRKNCWISEGENSSLLEFSFRVINDTQPNFMVEMLVNDDDVMWTFEAME